ncbi:MAG: FecR family protein [Phocaeicola sp.]|uniref:FecR family protein n=1 Tax=Phocaeicola sp. TaxID=2773926 RepID=UPI003F9EE52C
MDNQTLFRYISGKSSEKERKYVTEWILEDDEHKCEYLKAHKIYDATLWNSSEEKRTKKASLLFMRYALRIAAVAVMLLCIAEVWRLSVHKAAVPSMMSVYAPAGQRTEIVLPDSTRVWLNSGSKLTFANKFEGETRNVTLDGEGYFEVKKDISKPFIVETNKLNIRVLGTEFNVIAYGKENTWETSLIRGSIELFDHANQSMAAKVEPNSTAILINNKIIKKPIENKEYFLWTKGLICFNNKTIKEILKKLSLYYDYNIIIRDSKYLDRQYTGKFWTHDGIEHVLKVLQLDSKFKFIIKGETKNVIIY